MWTSKRTSSKKNEPRNKMEYISEELYEKFIIDKQLVPMPLDAQMLHIEYALREELLELQIENSTEAKEVAELELIIWRDIKPIVKFLRAFKRFPNEIELKDFKDYFAFDRTIKDKVKENGTFTQHIAKIQAIADLQKKFNFPVKKEAGTLDAIKKELGDILFFVSAAGYEFIRYQGEIVSEAKAVLITEIAKHGFTFGEIRQNNFDKLSDRYKDGYTIKEDANRKGV